jgi:hypothetical protein
MKRLSVLLTGLAIAMLAVDSPAAAATPPKQDPPVAHHVPNFPEQPDTNPGAEDNGCAAILSHPGVAHSTSREATPAQQIRTAIYVDACLGGR